MKKKLILLPLTLSMLLPSLGMTQFVAAAMDSTSIRSDTNLEYSDAKVNTFDVSLVKLGKTVVGGYRSKVFQSWAHVTTNTTLTARQFKVTSTIDDLTITETSNYSCKARIYYYGMWGNTKETLEETYDCKLPYYKLKKPGYYKIVYNFVDLNSNKSLSVSLHNIYARASIPLKYRTLATTADGVYVDLTKKPMNFASIYNELSDAVDSYTIKSVPYDSKMVYDAVQKGQYTVNIFDESVNPLDFGKIKEVEVSRRVKGSEDFKVTYHKTYKTPTYSPQMMLTMNGGECIFRVKLVNESDKVFYAYTPVYKVYSATPVVWEYYSSKGYTHEPSTVTTDGVKTYKSSPKLNAAFLAGDTASICRNLANMYGFRIENNSDLTIEYTLMSDYNKGKPKWDYLYSTSKFGSSGITPYIAPGNYILRVKNKYSDKDSLVESVTLHENVVVTKPRANIDIYDSFITEYGKDYVESKYGVNFEKLINAVVSYSSSVSDSCDEVNENYTLMREYSKDLWYINNACEKGSKDGTNKVLSTNYKNPYDLEALFYGYLPVFNKEKVESYVLEYSYFAFNGLVLPAEENKAKQYKIYVDINKDGVYKLVNSSTTGVTSNGNSLKPGVYDLLIETSYNGKYISKTKVSNCPLKGVYGSVLNVL